MACACRLTGLECMVYMVRISYDQKPYRRIMMKTYGADIVASPSELTQAGRNILAQHPDSPGSLGIAISEAIEDAAKRDDTKYALGSVLNHVLLHQTIIGQEAKRQMELAGEYPDILIGCHGGGSNFAGLVFPFLRDKLKGERPALRAIAVEPAACPSLTAGARRASNTVADARASVAEAILGRDQRLVVVVGPCSIHDTTAALEYAGRLSAIAAVSPTA